MDSLIESFKQRNALICVVGLGYVGLPLAITFAQTGHRVVGIDTDVSKVNLINRGISYIKDINTTELEHLVSSQLIQATNSFQAVEKAQAVIVCVPTPVDEFHDPDLSYINNAMKQIAQFAHPELLIVLESTTYPGTTREIVASHFTESNLTIGEDLFLCFSPERIDPGRKDWTSHNTPKVIGGLTHQCLKVGHALYETALKKVVQVSSTDAAEMVKILENSFRAINIAFINEMMIICDKLALNVWEIIEAAGTKPFGFMKFTPGPGVGGHCIPVDPLYLTWKLNQLGEQTKFISLAHEVNSSMPAYWVMKAKSALENQLNQKIEESKVLVLGVAYKKDIDDVRESPSLEILKHLLDSNCHVQYHDFFIPSIRIQDNTLHSVVDLYHAVNEADCVILATDHTSYNLSELNELATILINCRGQPHYTCQLKEEEEALAIN